MHVQSFQESFPSHGSGNGYVLHDTPSSGRTSRPIELLPALIKQALIPKLLARFASTPSLAAPEAPLVRRLVGHLQQQDTEAATATLREIDGGALSVEALFSAGIEPAARMLGDLWASDDCSETDVMIALGQMRGAAREIRQAPFNSSGRSQLRALVVTMPGEQHMLGAALDAERLLESGWDVQVEFPAACQNLQNLVSTSGFELLDLALSPAFSRVECLDRIAETIASARSASCNPHMKVTVAGRLFFDSPDAWQQVGADYPPLTGGVRGRFSH